MAKMTPETVTVLVAQRILAASRSLDRLRAKDRGDLHSPRDFLINGERIAQALATIDALEPIFEALTGEFPSIPTVTRYAN